jgi:hypothetical protein
MESAEVGGWILPGNVHTLMFWIAHYVGYSFDDSEWQAVQAALPGTDAEKDSGWYDYPLLGEPALTVWLAENPGDTPVSVRVTGDMDAVLAARVETVIHVLQDVDPAI